MRDILAERLLAKVMNWENDEISRERPFLQAMAAFKYDEYQQFAPGMKFIESLAMWLSQFEKLEERRVAYEFIKNRLIFISSAEMTHLVSIAYPDYIKPLLIKKIAREADYPEYMISKIVNSKQFKVLRRQSLFLGLSDGARIDVFRRSSKELSHEQIWPIYDISGDRAQEMIEKLKKDLSKYLSGAQLEEVCKFRAIFLLDDFSASGLSYLRKEGDKYKGKIYRFYRKMIHPEGELRSIISDDAMVYVILYVATDKAKEHIEQMMDELFEENKNDEFEYGVRVIQQIGDECRVGELEIDKEFVNKLIDKYYDSRIQDEHTDVGGTKDLKFGFAGCALPVVLHHNTPNNSIALLWSYDDEDIEIRGLFPRVRRHGVRV